ncbi:MAG: hypothetical protein KBS54_04880 [Synergistaceae bacterium]|nr:hypothetical protein [Candidatus Equadaptatus faecalis]
MKTAAKSKFLAFFAVIALFSAVIFAGGCDGSSSSSSSKGLILAYDQDKDGVPDVLDNYPADRNKWAYQKANELDTLEDVDAKTLAVSLPCGGEGTFKAAECKAGEAVKYFLFKAEAGKPVCAFFMAPDYSLGQALPFAADITVLPYAEMTPVTPGEDEQEGTDEDPVQKADPSEIIPLEDTSLECEVKEFGTDSITTVRFTPKKSGIYVLKVRKADAYGEENQDDKPDEKFSFIMFNDTDGNCLDDVWNEEYTPEDFVKVINLLQPFLTGEVADGKPKMKENIIEWKYDDGTEEYITPEDVVMDYLGQSANNNANSGNGTFLDAATMTRELYGMPFIDGFGMSNLGKGLNAVFGPRSATGEKTVASMTAPDKSKYTGGFKGSTTLEFINTDAQLEKEVSNTTSFGIDTTVGKTPLKISDKHSWANSTKFSETTTTLRIKYTRVSNEYLDGTNVKLTADAEKALNKDTSAGKAAFRREYGDYYLAGCQIGAQCVATLSITASNKQDITTIQNVLQGTIGPVKLDNEFKNKLTQALGRTRIKYSCNLVGGEDIPLPKPKSGNGGAEMVSNIVENVNAYMKGVNVSNMAVINCHFKHISTLTDRFPAAMPASKDYFAKEGRLYNLLWSMQARSNVIDGLDNDIFASYEKQKFTGKYTEFQRRINSIADESEMISNIDSNVREAQNMLGEMQAVIDRYYFWCKLIDQRKNWWYADGWGDYGYKTYPESAVVNEDINQGYKGYTGGWHRGAHFFRLVMYSPDESNNTKKMTSMGDDYRIVYASLQHHNHKYDSIWDYAWYRNNLLSFGGHVLFHYWKGGVWAGVDYDFEYRGAYMPYSKYPFVAKSLDDARPAGRMEDRVKK